LCMVATQLSGSLIVRDKNLLMIYDEESDEWNVPNGRGQRGELSADTAERIAEEHTGCSSDATRYMSKLKTSFEAEGEEITWQPYMVEIEGEPEKAEWVNLGEIKEEQVAEPLQSIFEKLKNKL
jgi:ADP-ribose pyrophosphatase YjhB (NUDIX family)